MKKSTTKKLLPPWIGEEAEKLAKENRWILRHLSKEPILLTGCTGFFGIWILGTFRAAWERFHYRFDLTIVTRNKKKFIRENPAFQRIPGWRFLEGSVVSMDFPQRRFSYILHGAATSARETFQGEPPFAKFLTVFEGTRNLLRHCAKYPPKNFLYLSSGAVYDDQPDQRLKEGMPCTIPENFDAKTAWKTAKIMAEALCKVYGQTFCFPVKVARCFSFYGPGLPTDLHYALGNFIKDAIEHRIIIIKGDGKDYRSYLCIEDAVNLIIKILNDIKESTTFNIGGKKAFTILQYAQFIASLFKPKLKIVLLKNKKYKVTNRNFYIPNVQKVINKYKQKKEIHIKQKLKTTVLKNLKEPSISKKYIY